VTITVTAANDVPVAAAQSVGTAEDTAKSITLGGSDVDGDSLTYAIVSGPANGTLSGTAPNVTYTPAADYSGADSFTFIANDGTVDSATATVSIAVSAVNDAPVASAQSVSTTEGVALPITLAGTDVEGSALTYAIVTPPANGTLSGSAPNVIYIPTGSYNGADSFTFKANDGNLDSASATVSVTVTSATFAWNSAIAGNWSDGTKWTAGSSPASSGLSNYILNFTALGTYTTTNDLNSGFLLNRINFGGSTATLAGNSLALVANSATLPQVNQDSANSATVSANLALNANTTLGGSGTGALTLSGIISGSNSLTKTTTGSLTLSGLNTYSGGTTVSSGTLTLANQNGLGTGALTLAAGTTFQQSNFEGNSSAGALPNTLVLNGNVTMNMPFGWKDVWLSQPVSGTGGFTVQGGNRSLTLTASNTFRGGVTLKNYDNRIQISHLNALGTGTYRTERTTAGSEGKLIALANLSVGAGVANAVDIAADAYFNVFADGTNHLLLSGPITSAVGSGHLYKSGTAKLTLSGVNTYTGSTTVAGGTLDCTYADSLGEGSMSVGSSGKLGLVFTGTRQIAALSLAGVTQPNGSYGSTASPATNKNDTYFTGTGSVTVGPLNTAPVASAQSVSTPEDAAKSITLTATDVDGNPLTYTIIALPTSGTLSGTAPNLTYTPAANYYGGDSFTFKANDGTLDSNVATVTITVTPVNDAPVAFAQSVSTAEDSAKAIALTASDVDSGSVTYSIVTPPANGTLSGTAPNLTYTPAANYNGADSFTFKANDGSLDSATASVTITVTSVNDAPVAFGQSVTTAEDAAKAITLSATDVDGGGLAYSIVSQPTNGTLSGTAPNLTYSPTANYNGADSFTFKANDGTIDSAAATVTITVTAVNDAPVFTVNPIIATDGVEGTAYTGQTLSGRATDADAGDTITYSKVSGPAWLAVATNGALSGTPTLGSAGLNSFVVRATDSTSATADAGLQITVTALPLPWVTGDIGTGMLAGSVSHSAGTFTQAGSGTLGTTSDKLRFTYQTLSGDGEIIAKISVLQDTGTASRVGVMIRDTLATNSMQIFMGMSGTNAYRWVRRTTTGGTATTSSSSTGTVPNTWVRLVRSGTTITAYKGTNGTTWTTVGSTTVTMATNCYIGLAVTSGATTTLNTSQFSNLSVTP
jgi:autotransporter-associated beta strand protein/VCBS repeat-containing protein